MKRLSLILLVLIALFAAGVPAALGQSCATPPPTYTATPGYRATVQALSPGDLLVYYPLNETSGTAAEDDSGNNADGTYSGVTLNTGTFLTGEAAGTFDGVNDRVNVYTAFLASVINFNEGTLSIWIKPDPTFLASTTSGQVAMFANSAVSSAFQIFKSTTAYRYFFRRIETGTNRTVTNDNTSTSWLNVTLTWSAAANAIVAYVAGASVGSSTAASVTASLDSARAVIGAQSSTSGALPWNGSIAQVALWDIAANATQVARLATVDPVLTIPPTATLCPTYTHTPTHTPTVIVSWTPTYTPTPTPTPTFTYTPNIRTYLTVVPPGSSAPGQDVLILHQVTIGQALIASLLFLVVVLYALSFARKLRRGNG